MLYTHTADWRLDNEVRQQTRTGRSAKIEASALPRSSCRIQLVDDNESVRSVLAALLRRCGHTVFDAADAFEALWSMRRNSVDLLVTDLEMPLCGGIELMRRARQYWPRLPVLLITGGTFDANVTTSFGEAACTLLNKPFSADVFMDHVAVLLAVSSSATTARRERFI